MTALLAPTSVFAPLTLEKEPLGLACLIVGYFGWEVIDYKALREEVTEVFSKTLKKQGQAPLIQRQKVKENPAFHEMDDATYQHLTVFRRVYSWIPTSVTAKCTKLLGDGSEASVYAVNESQVAKIYKNVFASLYTLKMSIDTAEISALIPPHPQLNQLEGLTYVCGKNVWAPLLARVCGNEMDLSSFTAKEKLAAALEIANVLQNLSQIGIAHRDFRGRPKHDWHFSNFMISSEKHITAIDYIDIRRQRSCVLWNSEANSGGFATFRDFLVLATIVEPKFANSLPDDWGRTIEYLTNKHSKLKNEASS
jgi:hypothetical protein